MSENVLVIAEEIFWWTFSLALVLAVIDWIRPLTVSPFFNVLWLMVVAVAALAVVVWRGKEQ